MPYSVIVSDLDGTLLNQKHQLSLFTRETLNLLNSYNIKFVFATGRHYIDARHFKKAIRIKSFMITSNGAQIHDDQDRLLFQQYIPNDIVLNLIALTQNNTHIVTNAYSDAGWFIDRDIPELKEFHQVSGFHYQLFPMDLTQLKNIYKLFYFGKPEQLLDLCTTIHDHWENRVSITFSQAHCLEVMSSRVSKGMALEKILANWGHDLMECIAFGDGMNDLEMLRLVGKGCIMSNADQQLKACLPELEIIGHHQENAVAHYLRDHLLF